MRLRAADALAKLRDARAVEPLIACLKDQDQGMQSHAADALGQLGDTRAVEPLISCFKGQNLLARQSSAFALGKLRDARAVEPLIACLTDQDRSMRNCAAIALGELRDARAFEALVACLTDFDPAEDKDWLARYSAADVLGELHDVRAFEPLIACLKWDPNGIVRGSAADALAKLGDVRAIAELAKALPDWAAKDRLGAALKILGWKPTSDTEQVYVWICNEDDSNLKTNWEKTKRVLLADMQSGKERKIENAVYTFVSLGRKEIIPDLIRILNTQGSKEMAEAYLSCDRGGLDKAALEWASAHGYHYHDSSNGGANKRYWGRWSESLHN